MDSIFNTTPGRIEYDHGKSYRYFWKFGETSVTVTYTSPDTQNPVIIITSPTNDQIFTTSPITVSGTASDNVALQ